MQMEGYNAYRSRPSLNLDLVRQANQPYARGYVLLLRYHLAVLLKHAAHQQVCDRDDSSRHSPQDQVASHAAYMNPVRSACPCLLPAALTRSVPPVPSRQDSTMAHEGAVSIV